MLPGRDDDGEARAPDTFLKPHHAASPWRCYHLGKRQLPSPATRYALCVARCQHDRASRVDGRSRLRLNSNTPASFCWSRLVLAATPFHTSRLSLYYYHIGVDTECHALRGELSRQCASILLPGRLLSRVRKHAPRLMLGALTRTHQRSPL